MRSGLYIVATPMGNFGDMSQRAVEVLRAVDLIAAEDTRHAKRLLEHFDIATPTAAYHDHSDGRALRRIDCRLASGASVALISDAGTPLVSDPGYRLVRHVQEAGHSVIPIPGPCSAITALSAAGLPTDRFLFCGFLAAKQQARRRQLEALKEEPSTMIFYEAPHRIEATLKAMTEIMGGEREACLARELTKTFETIRRDTLAALLGFVADDNNQRKGEIVLVLAGNTETVSEFDATTRALLERLADELPAKKAAAVIADVTGLRKKVLYEYLVSLSQ